MNIKLSDLTLVGWLLTLVTIVLSGYHYMATFTRRIWSPPVQPS